MDRWIARTMISFLLAALALPVGAATDGSLGRGGSAASSGSAQVGLVIGDMVRLSGLDDLLMQWDEGREAFVATDRVCVFRNDSGAYSVTATSTQGDGQFRLSGKKGSSVPYEVRWNGQRLDAGDRSAVRSDAGQALDCGDRGNVALSVRASAAQAREASQKGSHTDTLVLEITAE